MTALAPVALDQLFLQARTHNAWLDRPIDDTLLHRLYELARMGPTGSNTTPMRLVFVRSAEAKARLLTTVSEGNVEKTRTAPVTAIVAFDESFYEQMPTLFPARDVKSFLLALPPEARAQMGTTNTVLQAGYVILAARALGLDCGPMGGFDKAKVDAAFLQGTSWKSVLLLNLGYGDPEKLHPRNPRLPFEAAVRID